ncbi:unnamed protein product [Lymnaea stagnalis]|uniref:Claudin n=1 Tax=Lymnaea stagnalis TaxID=6523 RepID=A0AAV2I2I7_LYMST
MALPGGVGVPALVGLILIGVGTLLHTVGLTTPAWSVIKSSFKTSGSYGLWKYCELGSCFDYPFGTAVADVFEDCIKTCEAFAILGMLASVLGLATAAISVVLRVRGKPNNPLFGAISFAGCIASFVFIMICISVWSAKVNSEFVSLIFDIGYSFILSTIGGIFICVGGVTFRPAYSSNS